MCCTLGSFSGLAHVHGHPITFGVSFGAGSGITFVGITFCVYFGVSFNITYKFI